MNKLIQIKNKNPAVCQAFGKDLENIKINAERNIISKMDNI